MAKGTVMRHLHKIRLYFIKCLSCSGTTTDKYISIELESPEIQRHLHILAEYPVEIFILICKYLVDLTSLADWMIRA